LGKILAMTTDRIRSPNLTLLGTAYGLLWGIVALVILSLLIQGLPNAYSVVTYLAGSIPTGIMVTRLLAGRLGRAKGWAVWPYGPLALLLGTLIFAACMLLIHAVYDFSQNLTWRGLFESLQAVRFHDSLIMFWWYPLYGFVMIVPIFLAVGNCWDLRRRMILASAQD
jgi:hypothetical protein